MSDRWAPAGNMTSPDEMKGTRPVMTSPTSVLSCHRLGTKRGSRGGRGGILPPRLAWASIPHGDGCWGLDMVPPPGGHPATLAQINYAAPPTLWERQRFVLGRTDHVPGMAVLAPPQHLGQPRSTWPANSGALVTLPQTQRPSSSQRDATAGT